jgi:hypothetical protein
MDREVGDEHSHQEVRQEDHRHHIQHHADQDDNDLVDGPSGRASGVVPDGRDNGLDPIRNLIRPVAIRSAIRSRYWHMVCQNRSLAIVLTRACF